MSMLKFFRNLLVSFGFVGYFPILSGTITSIITALLYFLLIPPLSALGNLILIVLVLIISLIFVPIIKSAEKDMGHDSRKITIDEVIGFFFAVMFLPHNLMIFIYALILFRIFDIVKPTPINQLQKLPHGWGVLADDVAAGLCSNIIIQLLLIFFPQLF
ncbi:MAG: phosphatidylglycerophosphatase A [Candidatus Cloacimonetes bacterium]|nr:phosphatidylglycerophosphatase A [Candidatus Cloacimonadota bacterium]